MLPNKTVVTITIGLLLLPALGGLAQAQGGGLVPSQPSDLVVESVDVGPRRVVGVEAPITIVIRNVGTGNFNSATGWSVFVGYNGGENLDCIETESSGSSGGNPAGANRLSPCYIRPDTQSLAAGAPLTLTLDWNPASTQVSSGAGSRIFVEILNGADEAHEDFSNCNGPDTECENNLFTAAIQVGVAGVRARPDRDITQSSSTATINSAWSADEATAVDCPVAPEVVRTACRAMPGTTVVSSYLVTNVGTVHDSFVPTIVDSGNFRSRGYTFGIAPASVDLDPSQTKEARLSITFPENGVAGERFNVDTITNKINWRSTVNPDVDTTDQDNPGCDPATIDQGVCADASMPTFVMGIRRGANVTTNETFRAAGRDSNGVLNLTIANTGNAMDLYTVVVDNKTWTINDDWRVVVTAPGLIDPGASKNASITFYVPPGTRNGTYTFEAVVKSASESGATMPCIANGVRASGQCRIGFSVHVRQDWAIAGSSDIPQRVVPGEKVTYHMAIANNGNGHDNVILDLQSSMGWGAQLSNATLAIPPGESRPFTLTVTPPPNTAENTEAYFFVNATSSGPLESGTERAKAEMLVSKLSIAKGPNIALSTPLNTSFVDLGRSVDYEVLVTNTGNVEDNFTVAASPADPNWGVTVTPAFAALAPNQQAIVHVTLRAPTFADVGEKTNVLVNVASQVDAARTRQASLEGRISGPDVYVDSIFATPSSPYSGDTLDVSVNVGNAGNKASDRNVTLRLFFVQEGAERLIGNVTYAPTELPAQGRRTERFSWDTTAVEGSGTLLARIDMNGAKEIDSSLASNEKSAPLTIRTLGISIAPGTVGLTGRPGELVAYGDAPHAFIVEYRGNQPTESVVIRLESEHGWLESPAELSVSLVRGTPLAIGAKVQIPQIPGVAKDRLTIQVVPSLRPESVLSASTVTNVLDEENPKVLGILASPASVKIGEPVTIDVQVADATGVSSVRAFVTTPTNETSAIPLERKSSDMWSTTQIFSTAGRHRVTVEVTDSADPPNVNKTRDTIGEFVVSPGSQPVIKLAAGQTSSVRTGSIIQLDISDPLGVAEARYTIRGVSYDLRGPNWAIDTSTFPTGQVEVNVTAANIYGVASTARFTFTVDNTPPGISKVVLEPTTPKANEDVTVTITTDAKVSAVEVLVKRDGQVVESLNATRKGAGTFEVTFNPGEGDYTLDVTARDPAGNSKLAAGAVSFSAKPASPFDVPGPGLWLALAAVAVALIVRRRR